jgi:DNA-binding transcriptional MerR regulator
MDHDLTIEELSQQAAAKTSTIRLYQSRGLLPPPEVRGRVGYYSAGHLARLRVIARLQERGYSLSAIRELLDGWSQGVSLSDVIGLEQELSAGRSGAANEPVELTSEDFAALFPGGEVDLDSVQRAMALGLVAFDDETGAVRVPSRAFLSIGRELGRRGVPASASVEEYERLAADARRIADRFVALFERYVAGADDGFDPATLTAEIKKFREMAALALQDLLATALDEAAADAVARHAGKVSRRS